MAVRLQVINLDCVVFAFGDALAVGVVPEDGDCPPRVQRQLMMSRHLDQLGGFDGLAQALRTWAFSVGESAMSRIIPPRLPGESQK